jgi:hypothetical protein
VHRRCMHLRRDRQAGDRLRRKWFASRRGRRFLQDPQGPTPPMRIGVNTPPAPADRQERRLGPARRSGSNGTFLDSFRFSRPGRRRRNTEPAPGEPAQAVSVIGQDDSPASWRDLGPWAAGPLPCPRRPGAGETHGCPAGSLPDPGSGGSPAGT